MLPFERRWRRVLLDATIPPPPGTDLPGMSTLDLAPFWRRFDDTAPAHLKLGLVAATWVLGLLVPLLVHLRPFSGLEAGPRQVLLRRMERVWWTAPLVEVLKLVACLAFFFDDGVQQTVREGAKP